MLRKAKPAWDAQKDEGVPAFMARFKWEYPWEITFCKVEKDDPIRKAWKELPTVEELMEVMATDQQADAEMDAELREKQIRIEYQPTVVRTKRNFFDTPQLRTSDDVTLSRV